MSEPRSLWGMRLQWAGFALFFVGVGAIFIAAIVWLEGCAAVERDTAVVARDMQPILTEGCVFVEAVDPNPWVDFICTSAEAADRMLAVIPGSTVVGSAKVVVPDGGTLATKVIRVPTPILLPVVDGG